MPHTMRPGPHPAAFQRGGSRARHGGFRFCSGAGGTRHGSARSVSDALLPAPARSSLQSGLSRALSVPARGRTPRSTSSTRTPIPSSVTAWDNQPGKSLTAIADRRRRGRFVFGERWDIYVPAGSGVRLSSDDVFWGVGSGDSGDTTNDWGYSLIPDLFVRDDVTTSWSPGTLNLSGDGSPIWVTPLADDTTFWVDVDGDGRGG